MAALLLALCPVIFAFVQTVGGSSRPNVLFLVADDLRPRLGCYGEKNMITPNIDQLASRSVQFNRAYVQQAVCSPSRTSFLTGRRPDSTRIFDLVHYFRHLAGNYTTLPQHFKNHGYITQSVGKIFHPGRASGFTDDYPYSWTYPAFHAPTKKYTNKKICPRPDGKLYHDAVCPVDLRTVPGGSLPDIQNTDYTIAFLKNRSLDHKPFFVGMGYHRPHLPFAYPKEYLDLYPLSKIDYPVNPFHPPWLPNVSWTPWDELRMYDDIKPMNISYPYGSVPLDYQLKLRQSYSAAASYTDAQVGRVLYALDVLGLANNTIITFHGDHGWQLGEHGEWCKHTNFDIATRIPMLVYVPGMTSKKETSLGSIFPFQDALSNTLTFSPEKPNLGHLNVDQSLVSDAFAEAVDLYPTISELAGLDIPPTCPNNPFKVEFCTEGASLVPVIKNLTSQNTVKKPLTWKPAVFSQYPRPSFNPTHDSINPVLSHIRIMGYTMRTLQHRYTEWVAYNHTTFTADWSRVEARELYVYASDPYEDVNVAEIPAFQGLVHTLSKQLRDGWRKALPKP
ncbi:hypothetical protein ACOMHN_033249 [Nucella lapillus]